MPFVLRTIFEKFTSNPVAYLMLFLISLFLFWILKKKYEEQIFKFIDMHISSHRNISYRKMKKLTKKLSKKLSKHQFVPDLIVCLDHRGSHIARLLVNNYAKYNTSLPPEHKLHGLNIDIIAGVVKPTILEKDADKFGFKREKDDKKKNECINECFEQNMVNIHVPDKEAYKLEEEWGGGVYLPDYLHKFENAEKMKVLIVGDWATNGGYFENVRKFMTNAKSDNNDTEYWIEHCLNQKVEQNHNKITTNENYKRRIYEIYQKDEKNEVKKDENGDRVLREDLKFFRPENVKIAVLRVKKTGDLATKDADYIVFADDSLDDTNHYMPWGKTH